MDETTGDAQGESTFPDYSFVPGGPWPHPRPDRTWPDPIEGDEWERSPAYLRGIALFNAGYYWEAHEVWESLWHAHRRKGPIADVLKALIKMAAAGVKVREGHPHGTRTHAGRAAVLFEQVRSDAGAIVLGLDLGSLAGIARGVAQDPPIDPGSRDDRVTRVFSFVIEPSFENKSGPGLKQE